jgi:hypothetical protein
MEGSPSNVRLCLEAGGGQAFEIGRDHAMAQGRGQPLVTKWLPHCALLDDQFYGRIKAPV